MPWHTGRVSRTAEEIEEVEQLVQRVDERIEHVERQLRHVEEQLETVLVVMESLAELVMNWQPPEPATLHAGTPEPR